MTSSSNNWESDFDKEFLSKRGKMNAYSGLNVNPGVVKQFIRSILSAQREEIAGKVRGMKAQGHDWSSDTPSQRHLIIREDVLALLQEPT